MCVFCFQARVDILNETTASMFQSETLNAQRKLVETVASKWNVNELKFATVLEQTEKLKSACSSLKRNTLNVYGLPKPWALPLVTHASGTTRQCQDNVTGRWDIHFHSQFKAIPQEVHDSLSLLQSEMVSLMVCAGIPKELAQGFRYSEPTLKVNCLRCERLPFLHTRRQDAAAFEDILVLLAIDASNPIALWDQSALKGIDGCPVSYIPFLDSGQALIFTETPFALLSTLQTQGGELASSFILMRVCLREGCLSSNNPMALRAEIWNPGPENWLQSATIQPPVALCCVCHGYIRERRHGDLSGSRDVNRDYNCSGFHCATCAVRRNGLGHMVCELCMNVSQTTVRVIDAEAFSGGNGNDVLATISQYFLSNTNTCFHNGFIRNDIVDTLFLLIKPSELQTAAKAFRTFMMKGTWLLALIPDNVGDLITRNLFDELWPAFYEEIFMNAHCPRVVALAYAIQCALNTGPLVQRQGRCHASSREIFFSGSLKTAWNRRGMRECVRDRVLLASEFAFGLFEREALLRVAIRVFRLFSIPKFKSNFQCSCTNSTQSTERDHPTKDCQGPVLNLSTDKGQDHIWPTLPNDVRAQNWDNLRILRQFQDDLAHELLTYPIRFDPSRHILKWSPASSFD